MNEKTELKLNKEVRSQNIDVKKYEHLFIGVELECANISTSETARYYNVSGLKTYGKGMKSIFKTFSDGSKIETKIETNLYKELPIVTQVYDDSSVGTEVVCRPVSIGNLDLIKPVYDYMKSKGANFYSYGAGGCHMTFLTDQHSELSKWDSVVLKNVIQLCRRFYPTLINMWGNGEGQTRGTWYRKINTLSQMQNMSTEHYSAVSLRKNDDGSIWGFEIRLPDASNSWEYLEKQIKFYCALIRQAAIISQFGLITFSTEIWDDNVAFFEAHNSTRRISIAIHPNKYRKDIKLLNRVLEQSLIHFGLLELFKSDEDKQKAEILKEKVLELQLLGLSEKAIFRTEKTSRKELQKIEATMR